LNGYFHFLFIIRVIGELQRTIQTEDVFVELAQPIGLARAFVSDLNKPRSWASCTVCRVSEG